MEQIHLSKEEMTEEELEEYLAYKKWSMNRLLKMFPKEESTLQNSNNLNNKQESTKKTI